jgi:hypothetical protein
MFHNDARHPPVAIVNATLARRLFPGADAVGQRIRLARDAASPAVEIVGVADDAPIGNIREPHVAVLFRPMVQERDSRASTNIIARSDVY